MNDSVRAAAQAVARQSYGKLVAFLAARTRDVAGAEDALSEAFATALEQWPISGVPQTPEAWLLTVARRKLIDESRHRQVNERAHEHLLLLAELSQLGDAEPEIPDDRLRLLFACTHPAIDEAARAPLMLQTILGFDAAAIASAFLVSPATMSQRLVRAKNKIKRAAVPFRVPEQGELRTRLDTVLEAVYMSYSEGWADPGGADLRRRNLAQESLWLGRLLVSLMPDEPEALGLLSLMQHTEARRNARRNTLGEYVPLSQQDPKQWNHELIDQAEALLQGASALRQIGRFQLEAAVQSAHNDRRNSGRTDWQNIARIYEGLLQLTGSPVVVVNQAVALAHSHSPQAGLDRLDQISHDARLQSFQPYWAARAELLSRLDDRVGAGEAYRRAIGLESDPSVRQFLQSTLARLT